MNSKKKGNRAELEARDFFRQVFGDQVHTTRAAAPLDDPQGIDLTGLPFNVQVKHTNRFPDLYKVIEGMRADKPRVVVIRKDRKPFLAVQLLEDWMKK